MKMKITGLVLLLTGIVFLVIQNTFYGYIDADGLLHDSLFLPLGALTTIVGLALLFISGVTFLLKKNKRELPTNL